MKQQYKAIYKYRCNCPDCELIHTFESCEYDDEDSLYNAVNYEKAGNRNIIDYDVVSRWIDYGEWK